MIILDVPTIKEKIGHAIPSARFQSKSPQTVYSRQYGFIVMDEAHCARKHNHIHRAYRKLKEQALVLVVMIAMPVTTKAQVSSSHYMYTIQWTDCLPITGLVHHGPMDGNSRI